MHSKGMTSIPRKWKGFSGPGAAGDIFPSDSFIEHPNSSFHRRVNYHLVLTMLRGCTIYVIFLRRVYLPNYLGSDVQVLH